MIFSPLDRAKKQTRSYLIAHEAVYNETQSILLSYFTYETIPDKDFLQPGLLQYIAIRNTFYAHTGQSQQDMIDFKQR